MLLNMKDGLLFNNSNSTHEWIFFRHENAIMHRRKSSPTSIYLKNLKYAYFHLILYILKLHSTVCPKIVLHKKKEKMYWTAVKMCEIVKYFCAPSPFQKKYLFNYLFHKNSEHLIKFYIKYLNTIVFFPFSKVNLFTGL